MSSPKDAAAGVPATSTVLKIIGCVVGVVGSLLVYGILQERIMTRPYGEGEDEEDEMDALLRDIPGLPPAE